MLAIFRSPAFAFPPSRLRSAIVAFLASLAELALVVAGTLGVAVALLALCLACGALS